MTLKSRKTGSVRLSDAQYTEMQQLGINSESAYVRYKMNQGQTKLEALKTPLKTHPIETLLNQDSDEKAIAHQLAIQRLTMENSQLKNKLETIDHNNREALNGVNQRVHSLLQDELLKRDFETLKKEHAERDTTIKTLEEQLRDVKKESESRKEEIEALVKKLGLVELGKAIIPSAISGLVKHYPSQMKGIAGTLGQLGLEQAETDSSAMNQEEHFQQIINYLQERLNEAQFEQTFQLLMVLADHIKADATIIEKMNYYLNQLQNKQNNSNTSQTNEE